MCWTTSNVPRVFGEASSPLFCLFVASYPYLRWSLRSTSWQSGAGRRELKLREVREKERERRERELEEGELGPDDEAAEERVEEDWEDQAWEDALDRVRALSLMEPN